MTFVKGREVLGRKGVFYVRKLKEVFVGKRRAFFAITERGN
jgi:hypothetical protein